MSRGGIELAKRNSNGFKTHFRVWNMKKRLPYKDNFFDAVIVYRAMYHAGISMIRKIAKDVERVVKKGGFIYMESDQSFPITPRFDRIGKRIGVRTYLIARGKDGLIDYHYFNKKELLTLFKNSRIACFWSKN